MSWCGGGEIRPTPGVEWRTSAIQGYTLWPGSWPPSPGFAPWAILICSSSAVTGYSLVTPKRARGHRLDAAARRVPVRIRRVAAAVLATLAGVALAADAVHGDCQRFVRL